MPDSLFNPEVPPRSDRLFDLLGGEPNCALGRLAGWALAIVSASLAVAMTWGFLSLFPLRPAHGEEILLVRDDGRYASSPLKSWFDSLASGRGPCCSFADGYRIDDVDWEIQCATIAGEQQCGYRVRIGGRWIDVPPEAVVQEPNRAGNAVVWPYEGADGQTQIRCFLPGAGT